MIETNFQDANLGCEEREPFQIRISGSPPPELVKPGNILKTRIDAPTSFRKSRLTLTLNELVSSQSRASPEVYAVV